MLSILLRLTLVCMIIYGSYRVFREQTSASFCRDEAKKLEVRFEELIDMKSDRVHLRFLNGDATFASWLFFAPTRKSFELQLQSKDTTSTLLRIEGKPIGHYGLIQIQFTSDNSATPSIRTVEVFGPDFAHTYRSAEKDTEFKNVSLRLDRVDRKASVSAATFLLLQRLSSFEYVKRSAPVDCDSTQNALLAYYNEMEIPGAPVTQRDFVIVAVTDE